MGPLRSVGLFNGPTAIYDLVYDIAEVPEVIDREALFTLRAVVTAYIPEEWRVFFNHFLGLHNLVQAH